MINTSLQVDNQPVLLLRRVDQGVDTGLQMYCHERWGDMCNHCSGDVVLSKTKNGQTFCFILPRDHSNIAPWEGNVLVVSLLWAVESQVLPAPYYSEV